MKITEIEQIGKSIAEIEISAEDDHIDWKFEETETEYGGFKKSLIVKFRMIPDNPSDRKKLLKLMNLFMDNDKKFKDIIREFGHQRQLKVK